MKICRGNLIKTLNYGKNIYCNKINVKWQKSILGELISLLINSRYSKKQIEYGSLNTTELCWLPSLNISK